MGTKSSFSKKLLDDLISNLTNEDAKECRVFTRNPEVLEMLQKLVQALQDAYSIRSQWLAEGLMLLAEVWERNVRELPPGLTRDAHEQVLRLAKGQLKAWRMWIVRDEAGSNKLNPSPKYKPSKTRREEGKRAPKNLLPERPPSGSRERGKGYYFDTQ